MLFCLTAKLRSTLFENYYCREFDFSAIIFLLLKIVSNKQRHNYSRQRIISLFRRRRKNICPRAMSHYLRQQILSLRVAKSHFAVRQTFALQQNLADVRQIFFFAYKLFQNSLKFLLVYCIIIVIRVNVTRLLRRYTICPHAARRNFRRLSTQVIIGITQHFV